MKPLVSKNLRDSAKGKACTLRSFHCNDNGENVSLCHAPLKGMAGVGQKCHDIHAFYGCEGCHKWLDGEGRGHDDRLKWLLRAVFETQSIMYELGLIKIVGDKNN